MTKKIFFAILFALLLTTVQATSVFACSGYSYFGVDDLPKMDLLVRATVIDTDDRGYNAVIRVENYYKGEGSQLITVMRYAPALSSGALVRGYDTDCLYAGRGHHWVKGTQGYFGLRSNGDGTFSDEYGGTAHFYPVDGKIVYEEGTTEGYVVEFDEPLNVTEEEFIDKMLVAGEREAPIAPTVEAPLFYPLMRFLTVTTEKGTRYQVNPDRSISELPDDWPLAISPDGSHVAFREDDETITFQYIWTSYLYTDDYVSAYGGAEAFESFKKPGEAVRFSNDSNFAVVWDHEQLTIYMFSNDVYSGYGQGLQLNQLAQVNFSDVSDASLPHAMWSPDSSTIIWEDESGIWRWNIFNDASPEQLISKADINELDAEYPSLLNVSTYGRYVRVGRADNWILIDAETHETFANAIAAPTEQFLIYFQNPDQTSNSSEDKQPCTAPLRDTCSVSTMASHAESFFFHRTNLLGLISCNPEEAGCSLWSTSWHPSIGKTDYYNGGAYITDMRQMIYDSQYRQPALLVGDYRIYFDFYSDDVVENEEYQPYLDLLNLEDDVDSPIVSIEWGQPVFHDVYNLTTNEYSPQ